MFRKTHEAEIAEYIADLKRANEARDNWRDSSKEWEAKFKTAVAMNKRLTESLAFIERDRDHWRAQALRDEPDALAMRRKRQMDRDRRKGRG